MTIVNNNGGPPSYKALMETYYMAVLGNIEPTQMFMGPTLAKWFKKAMLENRWGRSDPYVGFRTYRLCNAELKEDGGIGDNVWFRNTEHPELDSLLINISIGEQ